jgi:hypothetical protein
MKFATIDGTGACTAFYDDPALAPQGAVQLTDAQWQDWVANQPTRKWQGGTLATVAAPAPPVPSDLQKFVQYQAYELFLLVKLVSVLLGKGTIAATDFDATTRSVYTKAKALLATALPLMPPPP